MKLNLEKMIHDIDDLVSTEFCNSIAIKAHAHGKDGKFTTMESRDMAKLLGKVYTIAHSTHCEYHGANYIQP